MGDINQSFSLLEINTNNIIDKHCPLKYVKFNKSILYMTNNIFNDIKKRENIRERYNKLLETNTNIQKFLDPISIGKANKVADYILEIETNV